MQMKGSYLVQMDVAIQICWMQTESQMMKYEVQLKTKKHLRA